ncbi:hypothetical protein D8674_037557 [Pyrus ussuriensis x Pyrus communis]|uniref:Uncharacterized protein n=1 Tax=Pyrus ussuriensis x Pyrus communis TaxID=2448454 RepID=A0A5N5FMC3_9ROSA|nr:hypothetical protein D8674_037557 [Pyrus ussuriensis x Pyrus communis]
MEHTGEEGDLNSSSKRKYKEEAGSIPWTDLKVVMHPNRFRFVNNCLAGCRATVDELVEPLAENESDHDRMMRLSAYVMIEYDDKLQEVERCKAKLQENNQFVDNTRKTSKALIEAVQLKDQTMKQLKRRNCENLRLKKQLEATILKASEVKRKVEELKNNLPVERYCCARVLMLPGLPPCHQASLRPRGST